jgi:hypothetical protein
LLKSAQLVARKYRDRHLLVGCRNTCAVRAKDGETIIIKKRIKTGDYVLSARDGVGVVVGFPLDSKVVAYVKYRKFFHPEYALVSELRKLSKEELVLMRVAGEF